MLRPQSRYAGVLRPSAGEARLLLAAQARRKTKKKTGGGSYGREARPAAR